MQCSTVWIHIQYHTLLYIFIFNTAKRRTQNNNDDHDDSLSLLIIKNCTLHEQFHTELNEVGNKMMLILPYNTQTLGNIEQKIKRFL